MLNDKSFADILNEISEKTTGVSSNFSAGWESVIDPMGMAQLMSELPIRPPAKVSFPRAYAAFKARPKVCVPHVLSGPQTAALAELRRHCSHLSDSFTATELKSAYRQCALKTHPDSGGYSEIFQLVKKSYQILQALVKSEA